MKALLTILASLTLAASSSFFVQAPQQSQLEFRFTQAGAETGGRFDQFTVLLGLNASGQPASLQVTIDTASVNTQDGERDGLLRGADLFDSARYPQARFNSTRLVAKGKNAYDAVGSLTLRNTSQAVTVPLTLTRNAAGQPLSLAGETSINRLSFGVGQGDWKSTEWVGDKVKVRFKIALTPQPTTPPAPK